LRAGKKDGFTFPNYLPRQPGDRDAIETQAQENACAPERCRKEGAGMERRECSWIASCGWRKNAHRFSTALLPLCSGACGV